MKRWILACFATLSLLVLVAGPAAAAPGGNAENAKDCQNGGYVHYNDAQGNPFKSVGECVSSLAQGVPTISVVRNGTADIYGQQGTNILYCAYLVTYFNFDESTPPVITFYHDGVIESVSSYHFENGYTHVDIVPFDKTQVIVVTDAQTGEVLATGAPQVCEAPA